MSVPVDLADLRVATDELGSAAFLVSVGEHLAPHVVSVEVTWDGDRLVVGAGRRTAVNVAARPTVTFLWPTPEPGGMSLLVDGDAVVDGEQVVVTPTFAIRHRSVTAADGTRASDCAPLATTVAGERS